MSNLLFCMTPGVSLAHWEKNGSLQRELRPYIEYARQGWKVKILTFDKEVVPGMPIGIEIVKFPHHRLLPFLPWLNRDLGRWADVIKTNQSFKAYYYTNAAKEWQKPIILRCGYVHGEYLESTEGQSINTKKYQAKEAKAFYDATCCQVPTEKLAKWVKTNYQIDQKKIVVVPNFVDIEIFRPYVGVKQISNSVVSVGRLASVKRFDLLVRACAKIPDCELTIIGEGEERERLRHLAEELGSTLNLPGNIPNNELPGLLQTHQVFATTSLREGHPKALIEAMACGVPCIGVKAAGIDNLIKLDHNGLLVGASVERLRDGMIRLFRDEELRSRISMAAIKFVAESFSFDKCISTEFSVICAAIANNKKKHD